jgi:DNA polymerase I-like protein with 3'-5' exonuclease and polymerase domains/uracil-DNA glycosylase
VLRSKTPVPPESGVTPASLLAGTAVAIVGEAPGEQEERQGRPFVGPAGMELDKTLRSAGIVRRECLVTSVVACRPPDNKLKELNERISRENKKLIAEAKAAGQPTPELQKTPEECCRPRLEREIASIKNFITLGKTATHALTGSGESIMGVRGSLLSFDPTDRHPNGRRVLPTVHPSFVLRQMRWAHVFRNDIAKAGRWFRGEAEWKPPEIVYSPSPLELQEFLSDPTKVYCYDLETDGIESLDAKIRCIGIGDESKVMVVTVRRKDGTPMWPPTAELAYRAVLDKFFLDPNIIKTGWNIGYYDTGVMESQWSVQPTPIIDGILLHRSVESELPHSLGYVASLYTDAPPWKYDREGNKLSTHSESDQQLWEYCALDVSITARVIAPLIDQVRLRGQLDVWKLDQKVQRICADMHRVGMYVDQGLRVKEELKMLKRMNMLLRAIRDALGRPTFNPGSVVQMRDLLFGQWDITPPLEMEDWHTGSGDPSTADLVLRAILTDATVPEERRSIIKLIRYYRKVQKLLGTYVVKLRPNDQEVEDDLGWDDDDDFLDKETRKKYGLKKRGIVYPATGRMHPGWNAQVAVTGRLSSSKPINAQNFPKGMRKLVKAAPGNVLIGADMNQLELRIAAAQWQIDLYLRAFAEGKDPHSMTAFAVFGDAFCAAAGIDPECFLRPGPLVGTSFVDGKFEGTGEDYTMRNLAKQVQFASQYMASVETVHQIIQKTEVPAKGPDGKPRDDGTTDLPYALMPLHKVREMRENWLRRAPEYQKGWDQEIETYRRQGYLVEPVTGRRRDFLDGESPNELTNFRVQASAAGLMNKAIVALAEEIPAHKWGPGTGIICQVHDFLGVECPADGVTFDEKGKPVGDKNALPFRVARLIEECMNQTHPALPGMEFSAKATIGPDWKAIG